MSRKVIYARTHQSVYIPGAGELGNTFPTMNKSLDNLIMIVNELGLNLEFSYKGTRVEALIPSANVSAMRLAPEELAMSTSNKLEVKLVQ